MNDWLADLTVIEIGTSPAMRYCGRTMAQLGATVLSVTQDRHDQTTDRQHSFLQHGKKQVRAAGREELAARAGVGRLDMVIGDAGCNFDAFDDDAAQPLLRGIVDPFGASGPWADWQGSELVFSSLGGAAGYTLSDAGVPVYGVGHRYQFLTGMYLQTALLALRDRCSAEPGLPAAERQVRVSVYETVVALMPYLPVQYFYNGSNRVDNHTGPRFVVRCRGGWVMTYLGPVWRAAAGMLERPELADDPRFASTAAQFENVAALEALVRSWGAGKTVAQAIAAARQWDIAVTQIQSVDAVLAQVAEGHGGEWEEVEGGLVPGFPVVVRNQGEAGHG